MIKMLERLVLCYATEELLGEHRADEIRYRPLQAPRSCHQNDYDEIMCPRGQVS